MPAATARRLCPNGIFLHPRISFYAEVSRQIREIFERFTPLVEPLSLCGFLAKTMFSHRLDAVAVWSYLLLGWMPIVTVPSLLAVVPAAALWWMLVGGLCYTFGTLFLAYDDKYPFFHGVWHLFVIAGSTCHYLTILFFVVGSPTAT